MVFQSVIALTANVFPPSVIRLYRGHIMLILEKRVSRLWMSEFLTSIELIYIRQLYESLHVYILIFLYVIYFSKKVAH